MKSSAGVRALVALILGLHSVPALTDGPLECYSCDSDLSGCTDVTCASSETCSHSFLSSSSEYLYGCTSQCTSQSSGNNPPQSCCNTTLCNAPVRLVGDSDRCAGRVEVFFGEWGTVCDDDWGIEDAHVVCRQLGCGNATAAPMVAYFGQGSGNILLDNVKCDGTESLISECPHNGLNNHNCAHSEDASVICQGFIPTTPTPSPPVRLVEGSYNCSGRVEVFYFGFWGEVCGDSWDMQDAQVVCREAGCGDALAAATPFHFFGSGLTWLDDVECVGTETSIFDCSHNGIGEYECGYYTAAVFCEDQDTPSVRVRLVEGPDNCAGRVEVFFGEWGTVCDDAWGMLDASVVCHQLECGDALASPYRATFGQGSGPIWLDEVKCTGSEASIFECPNYGVGQHDCGHYEDASVICQGPTPPEDPSIPVRLVGGSSSCSGRVEVYFGRWGTVCDNSWDMQDANVVCRELGCGRALQALHHAYFGAGSGLIWMDHVSCIGFEDSITHCPRDRLGQHRCTHYEDASVICEGLRCYSCDPDTNNCNHIVECDAMEACAYSNDDSDLSVYGCVPMDTCDSHEYSCCHTSLCNLPPTTTTTTMAPTTTTKPPCTTPKPPCATTEPLCGEDDSLFGGAWRAPPAALLLALLQLWIHTQYF